MDDQPVDPKIAGLLLGILRKELSSDPRGQKLILRFQKSPKTRSQELTDYLYRRLTTDKEFKERLTASQGLPPEMRAMVSGGRVDKIIQIAEAGTVTINQGIPLWIGLSAVVSSVIALGALVFTLIPRPLPPMGNGFNVAVAEFVMADALGHTTTSDIGGQFSDGLFDTIENETKRLPPALAIELRKPEDVGAVIDDDNAGIIASDINATILIYGRVTQDAQGFYEIEPHFYISDKAAFNYGSEVTGPDYLGQPIGGLTLDENGKFNFNKKLNARIQVLQNIVRGLAYFYIGDYESAGNEFQDAVHTPDWDAHEGQEVAYLLLGAARLRAWDLIQNPDALIDASAAFTEAHNLRPEYSRSSLGLGAVALAQAQKPNAEATGIGAVDKDSLIEAIEWYSSGLGEDQPSRAYIPAKSAFGLGQAYLLGYEFHVLDESPKESSRKYFQQVIETYQAEDEISDLDWFAAHAHAGLGRLAALDDDWMTMSGEYRRAVMVLERIQPNPPKIWIARFWSNAAFAEEKQSNLDQAQDYYERALKIGMGVAGVEELAAWQAALDKLMKGNP